VFNTFASTEGLAGSSGPDDPFITLADPEVTVAAVPTLPRHPETGKLRRVIPLSSA